MLLIKNLTITHKDDYRVLLQDFCFTLNLNDKAVIIGEEGNGKSTLLKLIYDRSLIDDYVEFSGNIYFDGQKIGYLAQEFHYSGNTVFEYYSDLPDFFELSPKELKDIAFELGLSPDFFYSDQAVSTLSGGEKTKLQLAGILMSKPTLLLLDEPSNDIDLDTLVWLENFINSCNLPVIFISHDEVLIENTANIIIHIEQLRHKMLPRHTIAKMPYSQYRHERLASFARQERLAKKERSEYENKMEKFLQIKSKVEHQQNTISRSDPQGGRLLKKKMKSILALGRRMEKEQEDMTQIPETEDAVFFDFDDDVNLHKSKVVVDFCLDSLYVNDRFLSKNISMNVNGSDKVCITGKNGAGKTTLLKIIADRLLKRPDIKASYMPQNYQDLLNTDITPIEFLTDSKSTDVTKARTFLGSMRYTADEMEHPIAKISGGQKAKLFLLKMILENCNVLILDEPTRNFSPITNPIIREVLQNFQGAIISVSHDRKFINEVCNKIYKLDENGLTLISH